MIQREPLESFIPVPVSSLFPFEFNIRIVIMMMIIPVDDYDNDCLTCFCLLCAPYRVTLLCLERIIKYLVSPISPLLHHLQNEFILLETWCRRLTCLLSSFYLFDPSDRHHEKELLLFPPFHDLVHLWFVVLSLSLSLLWSSIWLRLEAAQFIYQNELMRGWWSF